MTLTELLPAARAKFGGGRATHLRELPDGRRQVIRYRGAEWTGPRDESGVEVVVETRGTWADVLGPC